MGKIKNDLNHEELIDNEEVPHNFRLFLKQLKRLKYENEVRYFVCLCDFQGGFTISVVFHSYFLVKPENFLNFLEPILARLSSYSDDAGYFCLDLHVCLYIFL